MFLIVVLAFVSFNVGVVNYYESKLEDSKATVIEEKAEEIEVKPMNPTKEDPVKSDAAPTSIQKSKPLAIIKIKEIVQNEDILPLCGYKFDSDKYIFYLEDVGFVLGPANLNEFNKLSAGDHIIKDKENNSCKFTVLNDRVIDEVGNVLTIRR